MSPNGMSEKSTAGPPPDSTAAGPNMSYERLRPRSDRLVQLRVEAGADGLDRLEPMRAQGLVQLAHAQLESLDPCLVDTLWLVIEGLVQVVERGQKSGDQVGRSVLDGLKLLLTGP